MIDSDRRLRYLSPNLDLRFASMSSYSSFSQMIGDTTGLTSASGSVLATEYEDTEVEAEGVGDVRGKFAGL